MKYIKYTAILLISAMSQAQTNYSKQWTDVFSYHKVIDFQREGDQLISLTDKGVFYYNTSENSYAKYCSIQGLPGEETSCMYYDSEDEKLYIGYKNGILAIFSPEDKIVLKTEITNYEAANNKSVNHITSNEDTLYLSTPFGIVSFDITQGNFGDTFYIGSGSSEIFVNSTTLIDNILYAATENGIYFADTDNPYLIDASQWQHIGSGGFRKIISFNNHIYAASGNTLYEISGNNLTPVMTVNEQIKDITSTESENLLIITSHMVLSVNPSMQAVFQITSSYNPEYFFRANTAQTHNGYLYTATENFGILISPLNNLYQFEEIHPEGPTLNKPFSLTTHNGELWITYGGYSGSYTPQQNSRGIDHFTGENWINIPFGQEGVPTHDNVDISIDPQHPDKVYIASYGDGMSILENDQLSEWWTPENSALEAWVGVEYAPVRVSGSLFDEEGNLWVSQVAVDHNLKRYNPQDDQWSSYDLSGVINDITGLGDITMDKTGNIWITSYTMGAIVYNINSGKKARFTTQTNQGALPSVKVNTVAVDNNNRVWIGTEQGMVVFNSSAGFYDSNYNAQPIVIDYGEDDEFGEALLGNQVINDICIDGADNKWFATNSGVLHTNSSGFETLHLFNTNNSPLPSNRVLDIEFDETTGLIYFATERGIVAYNSHIAPYGEHLVSAYAFPNPVRKYHEYVTIDGRNGTHLPYGTNVKILDASGHLVYETNVKEGQGDFGGRVVWDKTNLAGDKVASGIYIVLLTTKDTQESVMTKIAIIN